MKDDVKDFNSIKTELDDDIYHTVLGLGENRQDTPLEDQIRFFKKFGFVLDRVDDYGTHHMILNEEEFHDYMIGLLKK